MRLESETCEEAAEATAYLVRVRGGLGRWSGGESTITIVLGFLGIPFVVAPLLVWSLEAMFDESYS